MTAFLAMWMLVRVWFARLLIGAAIVAGIVLLCFKAAATPAPSLPVASYVFALELGPTGGSVFALDFTAEGDIEGDVALENRNAYVSFATARPDVRLEFYTDRALSQPVRDVNGLPFSMQLEGVIGGAGLDPFDGVVDFAGQSGIAFTVSQVHRSRAVRFDVPPDRRNAYGALPRLWCKVRQAGACSAHGRWTISIDQVRAAVTASVSPQVAQ